MGVCSPPEITSNTDVEIRQIDPEVYALAAQDDKLVKVSAEFGGFEICIWPEKVDIHVSAFLSARKYWDLGLSRIFCTLLNKNRDKVVVDVGANIGYFSLIAASFGNPVYAFEPLTSNMVKFARSIVVNNMQDKIKAYHNAVSDTNTWITISEDLNNKGHSGYRKYNEADVPNSGTVDVPTVTLDQVIQHLDVYLLKIDIEGMEARVFNGAKNLIENKRPPFVFIESNAALNKANGCDMNSVAKMMVDYGYNIFDQGGINGRGRSYSAVGAETWPWDVVFVHNTAQKYLQ